ncbi:DNA/RNA non-specific endonuclease [Acidovorax sp. SUPP2539]|uniref:DNA/RNA non-specific endonuclease n=1 Tax=Acidovorax sp. SUPP2539 TaxID=2920878 RepID=UPI0023DE24FD|nr:DNA/RNA non-specific endonuclease [Acidovorax sp. SUPP2539]GKS91191.1 DNA/RNA non-specific endonuclease [Acidovorax sp. SUPP2539]
MTSKRKKKPARASAATLIHRTSGKARRLLISLFASAVVGLQVTSCGVAPGVAPAQARPPSSTGTGFAACPQHFAGGVPPVTPAAPKLRELCFDSFAVLHSGNTKTPVYVAQRLNRQILQAQGVKRTDRFYPEARLPADERSTLADYKGSDWTKGHMAPAGDMRTPEAMAQSFSLANMVPQDRAQNSGPWAKIEEDTRRYVMRARGDVYVITGPVFEAGAQRIGAGGVAVPSHLFKLVYDPSTGKSWAHWQQNAPSAQTGRPISYEELRRSTGMELLPGMH